MPGAALAEIRELPALRSNRRALTLLGYPESGTPLDEADDDELPVPSASGGDLEFCLAFDAQASAAAPRSRMGTWSFDADGSQATPGLNAFCDQRDVVEARLLQVGASGAATCLRHGAFGVNRLSLAHTVDDVLEEIARWPAAALREIALGVEHTAAAAPPGGVREPNGSQIAAAAAALAFRRVSAAVEKRFFTYSWNVGIAKAAPAQIAREGSLPAIAWCEAGNRRFFADPFGATIDGVKSAFVEEIDPTLARGVIVRLDLSGDDLIPAERVLQPPYHLSYPYVFEHDGAWYAIPESNQNEEVALYRLGNAGREWRKQSVLLPGTRAVDCTVFVHAGKFWMLCGMNDDGPNHKLHVFHADALVGPWHPHVRNPVKIDIRSSRPAGAPFMLDGSLHRPAQDCTRKYGRRVTILRITALDERTYEEELAAVIDPPRGRYSRGFHTLSAIGGATLVDGLRRDFNLRAAGYRTLRSLRRQAPLKGRA